MSMGKFDVRIKYIEVVHKFIKFISAPHPYENKCYHINKTWLDVLNTCFLKIHFPLDPWIKFSIIKLNEVMFKKNLSF